MNLFLSYLKALLNNKKLSLSQFKNKPNFAIYATSITIYLTLSLTHIAAMSIVAKSSENVSPM